MAYNPQNSNGQATSANSEPVVIASDQSAIPISATSLPLPTGASTETTLASLNTKVTAVNTGAVTISTALPTGANTIGTVTSNIGTTGGLALDATLTGGNAKVTVRSATKGTSTAADVTSNPVDANTQALHVNLTGVNSTVPVTGTFFQATQPVSNAGTFAVQSVLGAETTKVIGTVNVASAQTIAVTNATPTNLQVTSTPLAIAKGTQGATGYTTQDLKDAGRARVSITFMAVAPAVADTLLSLVKVTNGVAAAGATSISIATGKTLRINSITFSIKANAAAAAFATLTFRQNPAGATAIGSIAECRVDVGNTAATIGASDKVEVLFPDGMEFSGTQTLGISLAAQATTNIISISINGFEY